MSLNLKEAEERARRVSAESLSVDAVTASLDLLEVAALYREAIEGLESLRGRVRVIGGHACARQRGETCGVDGHYCLTCAVRYVADEADAVLAKAREAGVK